MWRETEWVKEELRTLNILQTHTNTQLTINEVNCQLVSNMIVYKKEKKKRILERLSLWSKHGEGHCVKDWLQILLQHRNDVPIEKNLGNTLSTVHETSSKNSITILIKDSKAHEISVHKGQGRKPILDGHVLQAIRHNLMWTSLHGLRNTSKNNYLWTHFVAASTNASWNFTMQRGGRT